MKFQLVSAFDELKRLYPKEAIAEPCSQESVEEWFAYYGLSPEQIPLRTTFRDALADAKTELAAPAGEPSK